MEVKFGTDGVRGVANIELTPEIAFALGRAGSYVLSALQPEGKTTIVIGRDTRISGDMLEAAFSAGVCSNGVDVISLGVMTTPGVAYLTQKYEAACGVVISASHNPAEDNGIKFFGASGHKLTDEIEAEIERVFHFELDNIKRCSGREVGRIYKAEHADDDYIDFLLNCYKGGDQRNSRRLKVVVDCAHGAASYLAPKLWKKLGVEVHFLHNSPDGLNINLNCGSTHIESLIEAVQSLGADVGVAYDGDADRCLLVDENGQELDGDFVLAIMALELQSHQELQPPKVVGTVMSNIGLEILLRRHDIEFISTAVGDRYVLEGMQAAGAILGGEQSGHIILSRYAATGDGMLTSLKLVEILQNQKRRLSELAAALKKKPQALVNVRIKDKDRVLEYPSVKEAIATARQKLGNEGKMVIRPSGTEPVIRLMAQGDDAVLIEEVLQDLKNVLEQVR